MMGTVNTIFDKLDAVWGECQAYKWAYNKTIVRVGYRGGTMEGNQCHLLLKKASLLCQDLPNHLKKFACALHRFHLVVEACFGMFVWSQLQNEKMGVVSSKSLKNIILMKSN